jgi:Fe-S-cluster-containing hydrogenase component 2
MAARVSEEQLRRVAEVCPAKAITVKDDGVATEQGKCLLCCACVKSCPTGARHVGDPRLVQFAEKLTAMCRDRKEPEFFIT